MSRLYTRVLYLPINLSFGIYANENAEYIHFTFSLIY